jgi:hypothetical protein
MCVPKIICASLLCLWCCILTLTAFAGAGAALDGYTIRVTKGSKPAEPNILAKGETGTFNFAVNLSHSGTHIEAVPPDMKLVYLVTSPIGSKITSAVPAAYDFPPTGSQNAKSKLIDSNQIDTAVSAAVDFLNLTGKQTVTLRVSLVRNSDAQAVADSESIEIEIVTATLTVYACPPPLRKKILGLRHFYGEVGHSFWKIGIDSNSATGINPHITVIDSASDVSITASVRGKKFGFYPQGGIKALLALAVYDGEVRSDESHPYQASKSYSINLNKATDVVNQTVSLATQPGKYQVRNDGGHNCTGQCANISNNTAGCNAPNGIGMASWRPNALSLFGVTDFKSFPNPYHHAKQLSSP